MYGKIPDGEIPMIKITSARSIAGVTVAAVLGGTANAAAQDESRIAIYVGGLYSVQGSIAPTTQDPGYPKPGVGGSTFGVVAGAAIAISPIVDLGFELSDPARFEALQTTSGFLVSQTDNQHRDLIVSPLVHLHQRQRHSRGLRFEAVVGPSVIWENTLQRTAYGPAGSNGPYGAFFPAHEITRTTVGLTGGVNVDFVVSHHLSVVPQARLHWISREEAPNGPFSALLGLDSFVFRAAIGIRASF
jgi:hypothetical protein